MFNKYNSLINTYMQKFIEKLNSTPFISGGWEVSEKIHGANFSFIITKDNIQIASRNGLIDGKFYNSKPMVEELLPKMRKLFDQLQNVSTVIVYGELYGDGVQREVKYYDDQRFAAFDVLIDGDYWDSSAFHKLMDSVGIPRVHSFGFFSFEDAMNHPNDLVTKHSDSTDSDNISEGVVIKPVRGNASFNTGERIIFKNKNSLFSEKAKKPKPSLTELSDEENTLLGSLLAYINENRVNAVLSKEQTLEFKLFGKYSGLILKDAMEEYIAENGKITLSTKLITPKLMQAIAPLLRNKLKETL